jgi:glutamate dehydrogenase/leucine dehydrogenase
MAWFVDEYAKIYGGFYPGVVTGKPLELGGSHGREKATSLGGAFVLERYLTQTDRKKKHTTVAIQGFGNVGSHIASILDSWGYRVVAVSDARTALYDPKGLNISDLMEKTSKREPLQQDGAQAITNAELLLLDVDVLIPAAISNQITKENASDIKAKVILEMANAPVNKEADEILYERKIDVLPDILANAGGVIVSYYEWAQNSANTYWTEEEVNEKLKDKITNALDMVMERYRENIEEDMRTSAYGVAVSRILDAEYRRGTLRRP